MPNKDEPLPVKKYRPSRAPFIPFYFVIFVILIFPLSALLDQRFPGMFGPLSRFVPFSGTVIGPSLLTIISTIPGILLGLILALELIRYNYLYILHKDRAEVQEGMVLLHKRKESIPFRMVERVEVDQSALEQLLRYGDVTVDAGEDQITMRWVKNPGSVEREINERVRLSRL